MPGRQPVTVAGLRFKVGPDFWLRRLTWFPFYFESNNPSFRVDIERVADPGPYEQFPGGIARFEIVFADNTLTARRVDIPQLEIGQSHRAILENVYTSYPGQTTIRLPFEVGPDRRWETMYSYHVRPEEHLWVVFIAPTVTLIYGVAATAMGVLLKGWIG